MRITFDTNVIDRVVRPQLFPNDPDRSDCLKINLALSTQTVEGVFSETIVTIEGVKKVDRAAVFGSTVLRPNRGTTHVDADGTTVVPYELVVEQPARQPLPVPFADRIKAALMSRLRMLRAPRIGSVFIEDPDNKLYLQDADEKAMGLRLDRYFTALHAIEARGVGMPRVQQLAAQFATRAKATEPWYRSLGRAQGPAEERDVERAFAEWSDADSIGAHVGYGIDVFCTEDLGNSAGAASVLDAKNRAWLEQTFGVKFATLTELSAMM